MSLEIAISPCPNDTFIFYELQRRGLGQEGVELAFADVEELNRRALEEARHPVTKLSCYAYYFVRDTYRLLGAGGALGRGCGPLLLARRPTSVEEFRRALEKRPRILIPGHRTTAAFLTRAFLQSLGVHPRGIEFQAERYDRIVPALQSGTEEFGVIIHEERFSFARFGLHSVADLGEFWERDTGTPIPLGCIAVRRDLPESLDSELEGAIAESIRSISLVDPMAMTFIRKHSQALEDDIIRAHIDLYVNDYSIRMGPDGHRAMDELFRRAAAMSDASGIPRRDRSAGGSSTPKQ